MRGFVYLALVVQLVACACSPVCIVCYCYYYYYYYFYYYCYYYFYYYYCYSACGTTPLYVTLSVQRKFSSEERGENIGSHFLW